MASDDSKLQSHFQTLTSVATSLNKVSDELTRVVGVLDEALKKLNLGLTVWVNSISVDVDPPEFDSEQIGYCKVNGKWGIALRRIWGNEVSDEFNQEGPWLFSDAPREMRLYGVDKLPEVVEALSKRALETTQRLAQKTQSVRELADAIQKITGDGRAATFGFPSEQLEDILTRVHRKQKFAGEILMHASRWALFDNSLRVYFPIEKRAFGEMLQGNLLATVNGAVAEVLGSTVKVSPFLDSKDQPVAIDKGRK